MSLSFDHIYKPETVRIALLLLLLSLAGVLIAGYHPGAEDDGVYLAAIQHDLHPQLLRADADFFSVQLQATVYDKAMAAFVRVTHLPVAAALLLWHVLSIFAILAACYRIVARCFPSESARWCGLALLTVMFTLPVAGTALYIVDQNLHPRAMATALVLFALDCVLGRRYVPALALAAVAFLLHPLMAAFGFSLCFFVAIESFRVERWSVLASGVAMPLAWLLAPASNSWRNAATLHDYYFLSRWPWYSWLGAFAPLLILLWFARLGRRRPELARLAARTALYGAVQLAIALVIGLPTVFERLRPMQPMRFLHLIYLLMVLLAGCFLGEFVLRGQKWRWAVFFLPAALGMFMAQRAVFPASPHLELPGVQPGNRWLSAFAWIREKTPEDAYFALGPEYLLEPGEDCHGFRALALRSTLADAVKDSSVAVQVPSLAARWQREVDAQGSPKPEDWDHVTPERLHRLKQEFGVNWTVLQEPGAAALDCPYRKDGIAVCRIH